MKYFENKYKYICDKISIGDTIKIESPVEFNLPENKMVEVTEIDSNGFIQVKSKEYTGIIDISDIVISKDSEVISYINHKFRKSINY